MSTSRFELPPERMMELAVREAMRTGDASPEDVMFYAAMQKIAGGMQTSYGDRMAYPAGSTSQDFDGNAQSANPLDEAARARMFRIGRELVRDDALASNVLMKYMVYLCGTGPEVMLKPQKDAEGKYAPHPKQEVFDEIYPFSQGAELVRQLVGSTLKTGNIFALHLPLESNFRAAIGTEAYGYPQMRAIQPDLVTSIVRTDSWSFTGPPERYKFGGALKRAFPQGLMSENVTHVRIFQEHNDGIWGLSLFWTLSKEYMRYIDWLEQRVLKARADNLTFLVRMREGAKSLEKYELPSRPMMIEMNKDKEDLKVVSMAQGNAGGGDAYEFRLRLAQGVHMPESEVSENAQYAAQIGKYGFPAKMFEYLQAALDPALRRIFAKTVGVAPQDVVIMWPRVDTRDRQAIVQEVSTLEKDRDISKREVRRTLGYSAENEREIQEELEAAGMSGVPQDLSGMGQPSFGLSGLFGGGGASPSLPSASPAATSPAAPATKAPAPAAAPRAAAPAITGMTMSLPASIPMRRLAAGDTSFADTLRASGAASDFIITAKDITSEQLPSSEMTFGTIGCDYGYAAEGAAVFGGFDSGGNIHVVGEATMKRVPSSDWVPIIKYVQAEFPAITKVFTGSDEPELTDTLRDAGIDAVAKHLGEDRTRVLIQAHLAQGKRIFINEQCTEVLADLFKTATEEMSGMATSAGRKDHRDAFRYMMIGLLEESQGFDIGSPQEGAQELQEAPNAAA
jgi:hypothetical protein